MTPTTNITTAQQLHEAAGIGRCELIRGVLMMMTPSGADHGEITVELTYRLVNHIRRRRIGKVYAAETGFRLARDPDTVRAPDIAFVLM
jgi:Uma2 family endonuclease